ncbi:MAG TPA: IS1634 family transposase [Ktedonobacteraceae bacterium]|jgi:transposase
MEKESSQDLTIETERVDDLPVLFAQMKKMGVAKLLDEHFVMHGNWGGVSFGTVVVGWLSHILSQGNHKLNHVEPWAEEHLGIVQSCLDEHARALDWSDDHLARVLDYLGCDEHWDAFEADLSKHLLRVYNLDPKIVRLDSTTSSSYAQITPDGLFQLGHSKDHRPDLPQFKVQLSALDPIGLPVTNTMVSGERADDGLYVPEIKKVQDVVGRHGLLYIGDGKMAALATRAYVARSKDYYACPLSAVQLNAEQVRVLLQPVWEGTQDLKAIERTTAKGEKEVIARGFEKQRSQQITGEDAYSWQERLLIVCSLKLAATQERGLRERIAKAQTEVQALGERGRGKRCFRDQEELQKAAQAIVRRHRVEGLLMLSYHEQVHERAMRRYRDREAGVTIEREVYVEVGVDEDALAQAIQQLGWQVYATNAPAEQFSLSQVVLAYRSEYLIEHDFGRLKGVPLSLRPLYLASPRRVKGLLRLLTIGLRVLILLEFEVRQKLAARSSKLAGLYAGQATRATARPTAEKLLGAFDGITLTRVEQSTQKYSHVTPLSPLQQSILALLDLPSDLFAKVAADSRKFAHSR